MRDARAPLHAQVRRADHPRSVRRDVPRAAVRARARRARRRSSSGSSIRSCATVATSSSCACSRTSSATSRSASSIVAGDLGDRGPRIDQVIDILMQQPNVAITWGNHDADWMGACLGQPPRSRPWCGSRCATSGSRSSRRATASRWRRSSELARAVYGDDPAERFAVQGRCCDDPLLGAHAEGDRDPAVQARGRAVPRRTPSGSWSTARCSHRIDPEAGRSSSTACVPLLDTRFPTIDWTRSVRAVAGRGGVPRRADAAASSTRSVLWQQMPFVASRGSMWLRRDRCAIFHGCVPVDDARRVPAVRDRRRAAHAAGRCSTRSTCVVQRAFRKREPDDLDLLFYLWTGPRSPCFGKDKMATFETYFVADKARAGETQEPVLQAHPRRGVLRQASCASSASTSSTASSSTATCR